MGTARGDSAADCQQGVHEDGTSSAVSVPEPSTSKVRNALLITSSDALVGLLGVPVAAADTAALSSCSFRTASS